MRMDNETFRLKVESLLGNLRPGGGDGWSREVMAELERLAATPRKVRYFLKAVSTHGDIGVQEHFYRRVMSRVRAEHDVSDLERHIRHMFYEDREHAKAILARLATRDVLPAIFRVIAFTEEGWLAGELIRIVLAAPAEELVEPVEEALASNDYQLQCLAIYLVGKSGADDLLDILAQFYRRPVGEKVDRLEKKALDSLREGSKSASESLIIRWLKDKSARVRELAISIASERRLKGAAGDLAGLVLIDPKTRSKAAAALLLFESEKLLELKPDDEGARAVASLIGGARQEALQATLQALMRDESAGVREVAVKFVRFLKEPESLTPQLRRIAVEDRAAPVQIAALRVIAEVDPQRLAPVLIDVFTGSADTGSGAREVLDAAQELMSTVLEPGQVEDVKEGIRAREEMRDAALERFGGSVEWWRHDI